MLMLMKLQIKMVNDIWEVKGLLATSHAAKTKVLTRNEQSSGPPRMLRWLFLCKQCFCRVTRSTSQGLQQPTGGMQETTLGNV